MCIATNASQKVLATHARKCKLLPGDTAMHCSQLSNVTKALHWGDALPQVIALALIEIMRVLAGLHATVRAFLLSN